jgi:hypothetical protein
MRLLVLTVMIFVTGACTSIRGVDYPPNADAGAELAKLGEEIEEAVGEQHDVLAPRETEKSQQQLEKARAEYELKGGSRRLWKDLGLARAWLNEAKMQFTKRRPHADPVLQARQAALRAGARRHERTTRQLKALDDSLKKNARDLDREKIDQEIWGKTRVNYEVLELVSLQESQIGEARNLVQYARFRGARVYAPHTLGLTEQAIEDADRAIAQNPYDEEMYLPIVNRANNLARVLIAINATARKAAGQTNEEIAKEIVIRNRAITGLYAELLNAEREADLQNQNSR